MNCGHFPSMHKNLGKITEYSEEEFSPLSNDTSFFDQGIVIGEEDPPLVVKLNEREPVYLTAAKEMKKRAPVKSVSPRELAPTKETWRIRQLAPEISLPSSGIASSFQSVLSSIKDVPKK